MYLVAHILSECISSSLINFFFKFYSTNHLRCMRLVNCLGITEKGLIEVIEKLPLLEDLEISSGNLSKDSIEVIGRCCPLLKSLKYSRAFRSYVKCDDDEAFAIAKTMPGLCHLNISGNELTNVGLVAILDGCPPLESLDLRDCNHLDLSGSLGERCHDS